MRSRMGAKTNYFRLGLFVVAAIAAAVASIVILLGPSLGKPYAEMETYFQIFYQRVRSRGSC